jgi:hypothetical protein
MNQEQADRRRLLRGVMLAILIWGSTLSLGAFLFGPSPDGTVTFAPSVSRGLIVFSCVSIFLGGWALLLRQRGSA